MDGGGGGSLTWKCLTFDPTASTTPAKSIPSDRGNGPEGARESSVLCVFGMWVDNVERRTSLPSGMKLATAPPRTL
jgi:hypothetical protein